MVQGCLQVCGKSNRLRILFGVVTVSGVSRLLLGGKICRIGARVGDLVDPTVDHIGHISSAVLNMVGMFTGEEIIDRGAEEFQPSVELGTSHRGERSELSMSGEGIATVPTTAEDDGLPEGVHFRKVTVPIDLGDFVENESEEIVRADASVEGIDELFDFGAASEVGKRRCHGVRS